MAAERDNEPTSAPREELRHGTVGAGYALSSSSARLAVPVRFSFPTSMFAIFFALTYFRRLNVYLL